MMSWSVVVIVSLVAIALAAILHFGCLSFIQRRLIPEDSLPLVVIASLVGIALAGIVLLFYVGYRQELEWKTFAAEHQCKVVGKMSGDISTTVMPVLTPNGQMSVGVGTTATAGKTGYLCNDGITYWR